MNKSGFKIVSEGSKFGLQNKEGQELLPCIYDNILDFDDDGYIRILIGEVYGTVDLEGKEVIPHSLGLTHLGVFHNGTARACKGNDWGLVDERGKAITQFNFRSINAHRKNGYSAVNAEGVYGTLTDDGKFTPSSKKPRIKSEYRQIATYREGIAPAFTYDNKWVFIDKNQKRVSNYQYKTMDPVLRNGLYLVINEDNMYNFCKIGGEPLLEEWYDRLEKFDGGYSIFWKGIRNEEGELIIFEGGQPSYMRGVIDIYGNTIIAPNYTEIRWANEKKEFWYAEKWGAKYHLYPDGSRFLIMSDGLHKLSKEDNHITSKRKSEEIIIESKNTEQTSKDKTESEKKYVFDVNSLYIDLHNWLWVLPNDITFNYRDTDLDPSIIKHYERGKLFRAGQYLEITNKLKRPVHNTRFIIASNHTACIYLLNRKMTERPITIPFLDKALHYNSYLLVLDNIFYCGINQVLLLHLPDRVIQFAEKYNFMNALVNHLTLECSTLISKAADDIQNKMGELIHGYSLSLEWQERMKNAIGLDTDNRPFSFKPVFPTDQTDDDKILDWYMDILTNEKYPDWNEYNYLIEEPHNNDSAK